MTRSQQEVPHLLRIRKYSNRRFYDATRSRPITIEEIHRLILSGHEVEVTDAKSGEDITGRILTQILLDMDTHKLAAIPVALLHRIIQLNETLMKEFVEKHFSRALQLFLESRKSFDEQLRSSIGIDKGVLKGFDWARKMGESFLDPFGAMRINKSGESPEKTSPVRAQDSDLRAMIESLQKQVEGLKQRRSRPHKHAAAKKRRR